MRSLVLPRSIMTKVKIRIRPEGDSDSGSYTQQTFDLISFRAQFLTKSARTVTISRSTLRIMSSLGAHTSFLKENPSQKGKPSCMLVFDLWYRNDRVVIRQGRGNGDDDDACSQPSGLQTSQPFFWCCLLRIQTSERQEHPE